MPHVARKISAMTAMPPSTGTTARASGERSRGGVTGEPGTGRPPVPVPRPVLEEVVGTASILAAGWSQSSGST